MISLETIRQHAARHPRRSALIDDHQSLNWEDLATQVAAASAWLTHHLVDVDPQAPPRTALVTEASVPAAVLTAALTTLKLPWVVLDPSAAPDRLTTMLAQLQPTVVARAAGIDPPTPPLPGGLWIDLPPRSSDPIDGPSGPGVPMTALSGFTGAPARWAEPEFLGLGFTSGTTGPPKMVVRSTPAESRRLAMLRSRFAFDGDDTHLLTVPLSHASSHGWARVFLAVGATVVLGDADPWANLDRITRHRIRTTLMVPPMLEAFLGAADQEPDRDLGRLRFVLSGGRHLPVEVVERAGRRLGPVLHTYYGTTETGIPVLAGPADLQADPRSAGRVTEGCSVRVVDLGSGVEVPPGVPGQIVIAGYMNADRYAAAPLPTVVGDGQEHFVTADVGRSHPDGRLELLGRTDEHLRAVEVGDLIGLEDDIRALSDVSAAAVVVLPDPGGAVVVAVVVPATADVDEVQLADRVDWLAVGSGCRAPLRIAVTTALPFNRTGKIDIAAVSCLRSVHRPTERVAS